MTSSIPEFVDYFLKAVGVCVPFLFAVYKYQTDRKDKKQQTEIKSLKEEKMGHSFNQNLLSNLLRFKLYSDLDAIKDSIFCKTKATRLMIFVAINGKTEPQRVFALYGDKVGDSQIEKSFKSVEIDDSYRSMLKHFENFGRMNINVLKMPKGILKDIYYIEEVTYVYGKFIKRYSLNETNDALVYMSIATDLDSDFNHLEQTVIDIETSSNIKPLIEQIIK